MIKTSQKGEGSPFQEIFSQKNLIWEWWLSLKWDFWKFDWTSISEALLHSTISLKNVKCAIFSNTFLCYIYFYIFSQIIWHILHIFLNAQCTITWHIFYIFSQITYILIFCYYSHYKAFSYSVCDPFSFGHKWMWEGNW